MRRNIGAKVIIYLLLILFALLVFFPILLAFLMSFAEGQYGLSDSLFSMKLTLNNYKVAFERLPMLNYLINSFIVSVIIVIGQVIISSLAAYAFVFIDFKGRDVIFLLFLATMMIPFEASIIPNFQTIKMLGFIDTYVGLTVPFFASTFGTFLLRQTFKQIPIELKEASDIFGFSHFKFYFKVALPMAKTSIITLVVYVFLTSWNMYLWPLLATTNDSVRTVQIGLKQLQTQETLNEWGVIMAGAMIVALPTLILLFFSQKRLQQGLAEGAIK